MGLMDLLRGSVVVEEAAPITEMTSEDYCRISKEYKEKAIEAMRIDFETRVKEKKFCVGDQVRINHQRIPSMIECFGLTRDHTKYDDMVLSLEKIVDFDEVRFGKVSFREYLNNRCDCRTITHVVYLPLCVFTAEWEGNKPDRC